MDQFQGLILAPILQPALASLVRQIQLGDFIQTWDLLANNTAFHDQLKAVHGLLLNAVTPDALRARLREVPSLISWVFCFTAYIAVLTQDEVPREMLTYCRLIVREALSMRDRDGRYTTEISVPRQLSTGHCDGTFFFQTSKQPTGYWGELLLPLLGYQSCFQPMCSGHHAATLDHPATHKRGNHSHRGQSSPWSATCPANLYIMELRLLHLTRHLWFQTCLCNMLSAPTS